MDWKESTILLASTFTKFDSIRFFYGDMWKQLCMQPNLIIWKPK